MLVTDRDDLALDLLSVRLQLESLRTYVKNGRPLQSLNEAELAERYSSLVQQWSATPLDPPRDLDDCSAEFFLRDEEPPRDRANLMLVTRRLSADREALYPKHDDFSAQLRKTASSQEQARTLRQA